MGTKTREITRDEARKMFLDHVRSMVGFWADQLAKGRTTTPEALSGIAFSILVTLDGCSGDMPSFQVVPFPHKDDKKYNIENGEHWYRPQKDNPMDIGGGLHEEFYQK